MDAKNAQEAQEVVSFWFKEEASQPKFILTPIKKVMPMPINSKDIGDVKIWRRTVDLALQAHDSDFLNKLIMWYGPHVFNGGARMI